MQTLKFLLILFSVLLFFSCAEQAEVYETEINNTAVNNDKDDSNIDTGKSDSEVIDSIIQLSNDELFDTGTLKGEYLDAFLPGEISGYKDIPHSMGKINDGYRIIQTVSSQYIRNNSDGSKSILTISIRDYGDEGIGGERSAYTTTPDEPGYEIQKIQSRNMTGYLIWNPKTRNGSVNALLDDRFVVIVEGYNIQDENPLLLDYYYSLPLKELIELGNKSNI